MYVWFRRSFSFYHSSSSSLSFGIANPIALVMLPVGAIVSAAASASRLSNCISSAHLFTFLFIALIAMFVKPSIIGKIEFTKIIEPNEIAKYFKFLFSIENKSPSYFHHNIHHILHTKNTCNHIQQLCTNPILL